jgi:anti-sigma factor ChrR (cupin superfamily)
MTAVTPNAVEHATLAPLASRYVDVESLPWVPSKYPGIDIKVLLKDEESGLLTALFRWAPGSKLPFHEHVDIEQTYVLEGSFQDHEGEVTAGNFVWRPARSRHEAWSEKGALIIAFFLSPNRFFEGETRQ